ncbi:MAG TPA: LysR family transcriptional regulator [Steroidobacteraceae bacterium]|jgi:LysR family transcriptional regulator for metE and metH|nr:LysR family transcriptional regulator [Steroidobacteraceae bacterium]
MATTALEFRHLETLLALAECGSLSKAAERLCLTQSALSHQMKALESHFGAAVVEKNVRPLRFTAIGQRLLALARAVLPQVAEAGRDIARLAHGHAGPLRVAVQCHNCFDWLMPAMDSYRSLWPEVELDIISGFVVDPLPLLERGEAELAVIHDRQPPHAHVAFSPLFRYESVALMSPRHRLAGKSWIDAADFAEETLITYPVPDEMLDVMKHCLTPAGINPKRRTAELTVAILQLVASGRGIAALPSWTVGNYIERGYVVSRPIGREGLRCELYAATTLSGAETAYIREFIALTRNQSLTELAGVSAL